MELLVVLLIFIACMAAALIMNITMIVPLGIGFVLFTLLAMRRGFSFREVMGFAGESLKDSFIVIEIMILIGCLTGLWRLSGTVAYFVALGVSAIPPRAFILAAFLLTTAMSYALGTSFGVAATAGVILMSIARAGGVNAVLAAGAVMSGIYVGDRGSPASSAGNLVAVLTHTDMRKNVREMLKCSLVPFMLCCAAYGLLSVKSPMQSMNTDILKMMGEELSLLWYCIIPAVLMIVLPFCGMNVKWSMVISLAAAFLVAVFVQDANAVQCLKSMAVGYEAKNAELSDMLSGGGITSMLEVCGILLVSCCYGTIFKGTGMLDAVNGRIKACAGKIGRFPTMLVLGAATSAVFCNQTASTIMQNNLSKELYGDSPEEKNNKMLDMENSVILIAGLIPWCIASSVPLAMLGADVRSLLFSFYLWAVPLWWLARRKMTEKRIKNPEV